MPSSVAESVHDIAFWLYVGGGAGLVVAVLCSATVYRIDNKLLSTLRDRHRGLWQQIVDGQFNASLRGYFALKAWSARMDVSRLDDPTLSHLQDSRIRCARVATAFGLMGALCVGIAKLLV